MDFNVFREKLSALNRDLYVDTYRKSYQTNSELGTSGIYLKNKKREQISEHGLPGEYLNDVRVINDQSDSYVGWVTHQWVPEGDIFDERDKCVARGWRTIVKSLVNQGLTTRAKARSVFGWEESSYDVLTYEEKVRFSCQHRPQGILEMS